ncbi:MAG TPA: Uma2 family endonuclease [Xanthobacteraceae bacterium]|nr:Uma2 family endonuclease [Xanthobacteraceae bacterium]
MNTQTPIQMDKSAFLAWVQGREERYELVDGRAIMMTGASLNSAGRDGTGYTSTDPVLLIEVLSPSSEALDLGDKAAEYLRLPSLRTYVVVAQNEAKAWVWQREGSTFEPGPQVISASSSRSRFPHRH